MDSCAFLFTHFNNLAKTYLLMPFKRYTVLLSTTFMMQKENPVQNTQIKHVTGVCLSTKSLTGHKTENQNVIFLEVQCVR